MTSQYLSAYLKLIGIAIISLQSTQFFHSCVRERQTSQLVGVTLGTQLSACLHKSFSFKKTS